MKMFYGYAGNVLYIDLSTLKATKKPLNLQWTTRFIGGFGYATKVLYDETIPNIDPFSAHNILIIATGPLTGTLAPCSGRVELVAKSPLTRIMGASSAGGFWGAKLKHAGYDFIIIKNRSDKPVYIWIDDDSIDIRDASDLWRKDTYETTAILKEELGESQYDVSVMSIGPAGENLVRFASVVVDRYHVAARCGLGAVMGSKNLKAIAVRGTKELHIADMKRFREACTEAVRRIRNDPRYELRRDYGSLPTVKDYAEVGALPGKHYQTGTLPNFLETRGLEAAKPFITKADQREIGCYNCPICCHHMIEVKTGKYAGLRHSSGTWVNQIDCWGAKCAIDNLPAIWKCKDTCHRLGLDTGSSSEVIAFTMELYQRQIITKEDVGVNLEWGNDEAVIEMLHKIAYREGFGDVLAEGSVRASKKIGKGSEKYVLTVKGMEIMTHDPRAGRKAWCFGTLTSLRGGDNVRSTHIAAEVPPPLSIVKSKFGVEEKEFPQWFVDKIDMFDDVKREIYGVPPRIDPYNWSGKVAMAKWYEDLTCVVNSLGVCMFPATMLTLALGPTYYADLFSACTGMKIDARELMKAGERIFNLQRCYSVREGITRKDDVWPERFYSESLLQGSSKMAPPLSRNEVNEKLDEYYERRGWDKKTGYPTKEKLVELGLSDMV